MTGKTWTYESRPANKFNLPCPVYKQPEEIACFSNDEQRRFVFGDQELRYYYPPDLVGDLNDGFDDRYVQRDRGLPDHLDGLLATLVQVREREPARRAATQADVMCYRGVMTRIMCTPYERRDAWELGGTLYIEEHESEPKRRQRINATRRQDMMGYWGYKFEALSTVSKPPHLLKPNDPELRERKRSVVNTNAQYCSVFRSRLGNHSVIMGAEVDCTAEEKRADRPMAGYVELKTSRALHTERDHYFFARNKMLKFWAQSFLASVPKVIVGFRDDRGYVRSVKTYETMEIPRKVRDKPDMWQANVCLNFADHFLRWLRSIVTID
ncbi:RAI1 like PD-XK nuclease-domain-containing protein, partial [Thamnocephalis sphaerospora]